MGKLTGGIDYDMIGRLGNHVGRRVKGKNTISMRPAKSNKARTQLQLEQQFKFGLLTGWLSQITPYINIGFKNYDAEMSPLNAAVSYNFKLSVFTGIAPHYVLDYTKLEISRGKLDGPYMPDVQTDGAGKIKFSWTQNPSLQLGKATDKAMMLVYNTAKDQFTGLQGIVSRSALNYTMFLPVDYIGDTVQCWMAFVSEDKKLVSNSAYVGSVIVV